jgi:hypothetical protein
MQTGKKGEKSEKIKIKQNSKAAYLEYKIVFSEGEDLIQVAITCVRSYCLIYRNKMLSHTYRAA